MSLQPSLGTGYYVEKDTSLSCQLERCLTLLLGYPKNGIVAVGIYCLSLYPPLLHQGKSMDNGEKLPYVVGAVDRTEMEDTLARLQVNALIFHRSGIA